MAGCNMNPPNRRWHECCPLMVGTLFYGRPNVSETFPTVTELTSAILRCLREGVYSGIVLPDFATEEEVAAGIRAGRQLSAGSGEWPGPSVGSASTPEKLAYSGVARLSTAYLPVSSRSMRRGSESQVGGDGPSRRSTGAGGALEPILPLIATVRILSRSGILGSVRDGPQMSTS